MDENLDRIVKRAEEIYSLPHMAFYGRCTTCGHNRKVIGKIRTLETECMQCYIVRVYNESIHAWKRKHIEEIQQAAEEYYVE